jgi:hypothetical protein
MERVDYTDTFLAVAPDSTAAGGTAPPLRAGKPTIASATYAMIASDPYRHTSGDVIFTVWADRKGIPAEQRAAAREEFYAIPRACLRSSDLGKRFGWGIHADGEGRLAVYGVGSPEYEQLAAGHLPGQDSPVKVLPAMRSRR